MSDDRRPLVVVGGGPAGLAAALAAARAGLSAVVLDEGAALGGQYFRGRQASEAEGSPRHFARNAPENCSARAAAVVDAPTPGLLSLLDRQGGVRTLRYDQLVIATGAYDRSVALPGWTTATPSRSPCAVSRRCRRSASPAPRGASSRSPMACSKYRSRASGRSIRACPRSSSTRSAGSRLARRTTRLRARASPSR